MYVCKQVRAKTVLGFRRTSSSELSVFRLLIIMVNAITPESGMSGMLSHGALFDDIHLKSHRFDPLCTYEEMRGEISQTVQNLLDVANNDITNADQVMTHLSDWARVRSEENLARLPFLMPAMRILFIPF